MVLAVRACCFGGGSVGPSGVWMRTVLFFDPSGTHSGVGFLGVGDSAPGFCIADAEDRLSVDPAVRFQGG